MELIGGLYDRVEFIKPNNSIKDSDSKEGLKQNKLRNACSEFESFFIQEVLKSARKSIPEGGFFEKGNEEKTYNALMDQEMAKSMSKGRGIGIGEMLYQQLKLDEKK